MGILCEHAKIYENSAVIVVTKRFAAVGLFGWGKSIRKPRLNHEYGSLTFNE